MIHFLCPYCRKSLKARPGDAGKKCRCNGCELMVDIPGAAVASPPVTHQQQPAQSELPSTPIPIVQNVYVKTESDTVMAIRSFLFVTALLFTACCILALIYWSGMKDVRQEERFVSIGFIIGCWFGFMVTLSTAWLISEVVLELKMLRNNRH